MSAKRGETCPVCGETYRYRSRKSGTYYCTKGHSWSLEDWHHARERAAKRAMLEFAGVFCEVVR